MAVTGEHPPIAFAAAVKDALISALLALGLAVPILALRTEQNMLNELVLQPRWNYVAIAMLATFAVRLLYLLVAAGRGQHAAARIAAPKGAARVIAGLGLIVLLIYPPLVLAITGRAGAIKWIDNFGIQIMI